MAAIELTILILVFLISLSLVWDSLRCGITPVPSTRKARQAILQATEGAPDGPIIELGSGWGTLALALAKKYPDRQIIGYEISLIPWLFSLLLKRLKRIDNLTLQRGNFLSTELPPAKLLVCYLYPKGMMKLAGKLKRERPRAEMLISNTFALPGTEPLQVLRLQDLYRSPVYVYKLKDLNIEK